MTPGTGRPSGRRSPPTCGSSCLCFGHTQTRSSHLDTYCRGLLSDLPRKSVEPIALAAGTAVRTLQEFLTRPRLGPPPRPATTCSGTSPRHLPDRRRPTASAPSASIDETSAVKKGDKTPGVQRQYCGVRRQDRELHRHRPPRRRPRPLQGPARRRPVPARSPGTQDRDRCREAGIPDDVRLPAQVADRPGAGRRRRGQRRALRLADLRRGLRRQARLPAPAWTSRAAAVRRRGAQSRSAA